MSPSVLYTLAKAATVQAPAPKQVPARSIPPWAALAGGAGLGGLKLLQHYLQNQQANSMGPDRAFMALGPQLLAALGKTADFDPLASLVGPSSPPVGAGVFSDPHRAPTRDAALNRVASGKMPLTPSPWPEEGPRQTVIFSADYSPGVGYSPAGVVSRGFWSNRPAFPPTDDPLTIQRRKEELTSGFSSEVFPDTSYAFGDSFGSSIPAKDYWAIPKLENKDPFAPR